MLSKGKVLSKQQQKRLETIRDLYQQQKTMYDNKVHSVKDRIVSLSQICVRLSVERPKARWNSVLNWISASLTVSPG